MTPLREVVEAIQDSVAKLEDDLKVRVAEYSNVKTQLSTTLRKQSGRYFMLCQICLKWAVTVITFWKPYC
jgi:hypothetical protein